MSIFAPPGHAPSVVKKKAPKKRSEDYMTVYTVPALKRILAIIKEAYQLRSMSQVIRNMIESVVEFSVIPKLETDAKSNPDAARMLGELRHLLRELHDTPIRDYNFQE